MHKFAKLAAVAAFGALWQNGAQAVPVAYNGHLYDVITAEGITWTGANAAAPAGWHLATIGDAAENTFVESLLSTGLAGRSHFWIGATDTVTEGTWAWVDGTPFTFTDWWSGEPNNLGDEDFLAYDLRGTYAWNDAPDNLGALYGFARGYIIENDQNVTGVPEPMTLGLLGAGLAGLGLARRRRA